MRGALTLIDVIAVTPALPPRLVPDERRCISSSQRGGRFLDC
jgi:hypothetical protein